MPKTDFVMLTKTEKLILLTCAMRRGMSMLILTKGRVMTKKIPIMRKINPRIPMIAINRVRVIYRVPRTVMPIPQMLDGDSGVT